MRMMTSMAVARARDNPDLYTDEERWFYSSPSDLKLKQEAIENAESLSKQLEEWKQKILK